MSKISFQMLVVCFCLGLALPARAGDPLTPAERNWLAARRTLHVGVQPDHPPISFLDPKGQPQGIAVDFCRRLALEMGVKVQFHPGSLSLQINDLRHGRLDTLCGLVDLPEWRAHFDFTSEFYRLPYSIFVRRGLSPVHKLKDLWGVNVGVVQGDAGQILCQQAGLQYLALTGHEAAILALEQGRVDAVVMDDLGVYHLQDRHGLRGKIVQVPQPVLWGNLALPIRKDQPRLLAILSKIVNSIPVNQIRAISDRWRR